MRYASEETLFRIHSTTSNMRTGNMQLQWCHLMQKERERGID